jgi:hypothetical protein
MGSLHPGVRRRRLTQQARAARLRFVSRDWFPEGDAGGQPGIARSGPEEPDARPAHAESAETPRPANQAATPDSPRKAADRSLPNQDCRTGEGLDSAEIHSAACGGLAESSRHARKRGDGTGTRDRAVGRDAGSRPRPYFDAEAEAGAAAAPFLCFSNQVRT